MYLDWQAIAAIASFLAAFAAACTAWLIYRVRPLALRVIELHSQKFQQELLPIWKENLPRLRNISNYYTDKAPFSDSRLDQLEQSVLFQDLANHIPPERPLMFLWRKYRNDWESVEESRSSLACKVRNLINEAAQQIALGVGSDKDANTIVEHNFVARYYRALVEFSQDRRGAYEELRQAAATLVVGGGKGNCYRVDCPGLTWVFSDDEARAIQAIELLRQLVDGLPTTKPPGEAMSFVEEVRQLGERINELDKSRRQVEDEIESLIAFPLLPNAECPLIRAATPSLLPRWIRRLGRIVFKHRRKEETSS